MLVCALCRGGKGGKCVWRAAAAPLAAVGVPPSRAARDGAADHPPPRNITRQEQMERLVSSAHSQPRRQKPLVCRKPLAFLSFTQRTWRRSGW